jgi:hypothetical protein
MIQVTFRRKLRIYDVYVYMKHEHTTYSSNALVSQVHLVR